MRKQKHNVQKPNSIPVRGSQFFLYHACDMLNISSLFFNNPSLLRFKVTLLPGNDWKYPVFLLWHWSISSEMTFVALSSRMEHRCTSPQVLESLTVNKTLVLYNDDIRWKSRNNTSRTILKLAKSFLIQSAVILELWQKYDRRKKANTPCYFYKIHRGNAYRIRSYQIVIVWMW